MRLDQLPKRRVAAINHVDWDMLDPGEGQRLREFGVDTGAVIEILHHGGLLRTGAFACRVGRMTVAMRASHAAAIRVTVTAPAAAPEGALTA